LAQTHEESREKKYELEMSWICEKSGFLHQMVPDNMIRDAEQKALAAIE
jgi:20S proteasome subunit alpha 7